MLHPAPILRRSPGTRTPRRIVITIAGAWLAALLSFAGAAGVSGSLRLASVLALLAATAVARMLWTRAPAALDDASPQRAYVRASAVMAFVGLVMLSRLTVFMIDPSNPSYSVMPSSVFEVRHSCLTAYYVAADLVRRVPDVYATSLYAARDDDPRSPRKPKTMGPFRVDQYEYPPPFLLLPRAVSAIAPGLLPMRMTWFALNGLIVVVGVLMIAFRLRPEAVGRALLLVPFVVGSYVVVNTLQKGNVQLAVIAMSMIAMALVQRRRTAAGGALLAFVTLSKLYPGLLIVYLAVRRDWRALAWTGFFAAAILAVTLADMGWQPFLAFREQLPGLLSGEAFPAFRNPRAIAINQSIPGLVFKLQLFGIDGFGFGAARLVGTIYMLGAVAATFVMGRRSIGEGRAPIVWLTILLLATLRSPFLPSSYAPFPAIWLLTLLAAGGLLRSWSLSAFLPAWVVLNLAIPVDWGPDPRLTALLTLVPQALTFALAVAVFRLSAEGEPDVEDTDRRLQGGRGELARWLAWLRGDPGVQADGA